MSQRLGPADCWRVIGSRNPGADLFGGISDYGEWEDVAEIEHLWNERVLPQWGNVAQVPREHRAYGPGSAYIMGPFAYLTPGRFGDGSYGVIYAGLEELTALAEVAWHRARFMREWNLPRQTMDQQVLTLVFAGSVADLRGASPEWPGAFAPDSWVAGQALGAKLRSTGVDGIVYSSVRRLGGECLAGFRPNAFSRCRFMRQAQFFWDGAALHAEGLPPC